MTSGLVFTYLGETRECESCRVREKCHGSLSLGLSYRVVRRTDGEKVYCALRDNEVVPFEIVMEPLTLLAPSRVKEGSVTRVISSFCRAGCNRIPECPIVFNMLVSDLRVMVLEKLGKFECPGENLVLIKAEVVE